LLDFVFKFFKRELFDAFIKVIPNFSQPANVEFTIVCFDGIDVIGFQKKFSVFISHVIKDKNRNRSINKFKNLGYDR